MRPATADDPTLLDDAGDPRAEQRQAFVRFGKLLAVAMGGILALTLIGVVLAGPLLRLAALPVEVGGATSGQTALEQLEERSIVYAADGSVLAVLHDEIDRDVVELERIPEHVRQAAIAAEDRRFYDHGGYDLAGIGRALLANLRAQDVEQGGSTITQQIAKANFVGADRTIDRKVRELIHAVALEQQFSKDELLERYLNQVYFGAGAYGVAAAAEEFFRVRPEDLTIAQAAQLAGAIRSPSSLNPREHPEAARQQRDAVLDAMAEEGYIDAEEARQAKETPLDPAPAREREREDPYVVQEVKRQFLANPAFGEDHDERVATLFSGGLRLHTTIDPRLQDVAETVIAEYSAEEEGPTGALTAIDPRNGRILALDNGTEFNEQQFGVATRGRRQPGSGFKPFVVAAALEQGLPVDISLEGDSPAFFPEVRGWSREDDGVRNFEGRSYGRVDLREATVRSVNTAFAQLILTVGKEPVVDLAQRAGIDTEEAISDQDGPAIALGGLSHGVSPLEMASAYGTFATAGTRAAPFLIARVEDTQGETVYAYEPEPERRVDAAVSAVLTDILQDVVRRGTGRSAGVPGWEPAGKTGTSQDNADAWFTGYVPFLSTSVWVGHPEGRVSIPGLTGGSTPAAMWQDFMGAALEGVDHVAFPDVDTSLEHLREAREVDVPDVRRMNQDKALEALLDVHLAGVVRRVDSRAREGVVVWQAPGPGSSALPGDEVVIGVSTGTPPAPSTPSPSPEPEPSVQQTHEPEPEPEPEPTDSPEPEPTDSPEPEPTDSPEPEPEPTDTPKEPEPTESPESGGGDDTDMNQSNDETTTATSN